MYSCGIRLCVCTLVKYDLAVEKTGVYEHDEVAA